MPSDPKSTTRASKPQHPLGLQPGATHEGRFRRDLFIMELVDTQVVRRGAYLVLVVLLMSIGLVACESSAPRPQLTMVTFPKIGLTIATPGKLVSDEGRLRDPRFYEDDDYLSYDGAPISLHVWWGRLQPAMAGRVRNNPAKRCEGLLGVASDLEPLGLRDIERGLVHFSEITAHRMRGHKPMAINPFDIDVACFEYNGTSISVAVYSKPGHEDAVEEIFDSIRTS